MSQARSSSTSSSERRALPRFYRALSVPLLLCLFYAAFASLILTRSGEYMTIDKIIEKQQKTKGFYGSAILQRAFYYKQHLYAKVQPDVTTLGSSRVLGFRQQDFNVPFVNMGSLSELNEVIEVSKALYKDKKPSLVILGVDFWWFHPDAENRALNRSPENPHIEANDLFQPLNWILSGKMKWKHIRDIMGGASPDIGIAGISYQDGFDPAAAYYYTSIVTGQKQPEDFKFAVNLKKIKTSDRKYAHSKVMSDVQWPKITGLLDDLKKQGIKVLVFIPPLATPLYKKMEETGGYQYVTTFRRKLKEAAETLGMPFFDYHDGGPPGSNDCEFVDGHHGGTVIYQRILDDMGKKDADLAKRLRQQNIASNLRIFAGQASLLRNETDFLGLGCRKPFLK